LTLNRFGMRGGSFALAFRSGGERIVSPTVQTVEEPLCSLACLGAASMNRTDRETSRYFDTGLLIVAVAGLGILAYWGLK